jgi:hypothetical protein
VLVNDVGDIVFVLCLGSCWDCDGLHLADPGISTVNYVPCPGSDCPMSFCWLLDS